MTIYTKLFVKNGNRMTQREFQERCIEADYTAFNLRMTAEAEGWMFCDSYLALQDHIDLAYPAKALGN